MELGSSTTLCVYARLTVSVICRSCRFPRPIALHSVYTITTSPFRISLQASQFASLLFSKLHHIPLTMQLTEIYRSKTFRLETGFDRSSEFCHPPLGEYGRLHNIHYAEFACFCSMPPNTKSATNQPTTQRLARIRSKTDRKMLTFARIKAQTAIKKTYTNNIISRNIRSGGSHT